MIGYYYKLYVTTKEAIKECRQDVRSGHSATARGFCSYIRNGCILSILSSCDFPDGLTVDLALLKWEFSQLEAECRSETHQALTSDLKSIRASLDLIAHYVVTTAKL